MKFSKNLDKFVAPSVAVFSLLIYLFTLAPTVSFWDSGEFIACADTLQQPSSGKSNFIYCWLDCLQCLRLIQLKLHGL
jgi:hypothetical protein